MEKIKRFLKEEEGVTVIEYAVIAGLIIVASIVIITTLGGQIQAVFQRVSTALPAAS
jgi:pilus assembly protein Flp/PilA